MFKNHNYSTTFYPLNQDYLLFSPTGRDLSIHVMAHDLIEMWNKEEKEH